MAEEQQEQKPKGFDQGRPVPSIHDLGMMAESGGKGAQWNLAKELITGDRDPAVYLPRGVYSAKDIARRKRMVSDDNRIRRRRGCSLNDSLWVGDQMAIGLNGAGREDAKQVIRAQANIDREERRARAGFMGMGGRQQEI